MTDRTELRRLAEAAPDRITLSVGYWPEDEHGESGTPSERFYRKARAAIPSLLDEIEALRTEQDKGRRHPHSPERCPVCEWTNINLMNYGTTDGSRWMCHGCAASVIAERDSLRADVARLEAALAEAREDEQSIAATLACVRGEHNAALESLRRERDEARGVSACCGRRPVHNEQPRRSHPMTDRTELRRLAEAARGGTYGAIHDFRYGMTPDVVLAMLDALDEKEHATIMRIRADYDRTVADAWRAKVAEVERERDAALADVARLEAALREACDMFYVQPETVAAGFDPHARIRHLRSLLPAAKEPDRG